MTNYNNKKTNRKEEGIKSQIYLIENPLNIEKEIKLIEEEIEYIEKEIKCMKEEEKKYINLTQKQAEETEQIYLYYSEYPEIIDSLLEENNDKLENENLDELEEVKKIVDSIIDEIGAALHFEECYSTAYLA